tara:strand:- start:619 stop:783 length:165 start_codon:yes stop_codon:yes gene_type:complete
MYDVYGVSDWPESLGEEFPIFIGRQFDNVNDAIAAAHAIYNNDLEVHVYYSEVN